MSSATPTSTIPTSPSTRLRALLWFCTGAALAVATSTITIANFSANAAPGDHDTTYIPTAGCRLLDTRTGATNVGNRNTPLGPGDTHTIPVRGNNGNCTGPLSIPDDATGIALNATAVGATTSSNIRIYPANLTQPPLLSNLNVTAGAPPTPNKVDVQLSPDGAITAFNANGNVGLILDVVGYYTNNRLTDIDQRLTQLETNTGDHDGTDPDLRNRIDELDALVATNATEIAANADDIESNADRVASNSAGINALDRARPFAVQATTALTQVTAQDTVVTYAEVIAPVDGQIAATATMTVFTGRLGEAARCTISKGTTLETNLTQSAQSPVELNHGRELSATRVLDVAAGSTTRVRLVCDQSLPAGSPPSATFVTNAVLTAVFTPAR